MSSDRIDFISAYCDSWCDRCAFTQRCSAFAARAAIAMCRGDVQAGLELAVGRPHPAEPDAEASGPPPWLADFENTELTPEETAAFQRRLDERDARIEASQVASAARAYATLTHRWLVGTAEQFDRGGDAIIDDALDVIAWDHVLIGAKLHRALSGRDEHQHGEQFGDDDPIQNDWNGSAKVALVSLERSEAAWRVIATCTTTDIPAIMADHLAQLRAEVQREFPDAHRFVRPGFDEAQPV